MWAKIKAHLKRSKILNFMLDFKRNHSLRHIKRKTPAIIQILPTFVDGDAIGSHAVALSNAFNNQCKENYIVAENRLMTTANSFFLKNFRFRKDDILIFHMSIGCYSFNVFKKTKAKRKIIVYHNITPSSYFKTNPTLERLCNLGRKQLEQAKDIADLAICDSHFNEQELIDLGYKNTMVIPILTNTEALHSYHHNFKKSNVKTFLSIGRIASNKCVHDIINLFYEYHKINSCSKLVLIGRCSDIEYNNRIEKMIKDYKLSKCVKLLGHVTNETISYYYSVANAYICMSEHEGFCVPLVEAMSFGLPIFAYNSTAISETLSGAGVLFKSKNFSELAKIVDYTLKQPNRIIDSERSRYNYFKNSVNIPKYLNAIEIDLIPSFDSDPILLKLYRVYSDYYTSRNCGASVSISYSDFYRTFKNDKIRVPFYLQLKITKKVKNFMRDKTPRLYRFIVKLLKGRVG